MRNRSIPRAFLAGAIVLASGSAPAEAAVVISEILAVNSSGLTDEDGTFSDWVELHNSGAAPFNLAGYYLTDSAAALTKWQLPAVSLPAGGYLVVFASDKNRTNPAAQLHTNFKLSSDGEYMGLIAPDGTTVVHDYAPKFPPQTANVSYGVASDLTTKRCFGTPTPGAPNNDSSTCGQTAAPTFSTAHGFYDSPFSLTLASATPGASIYFTTDNSAPAPTNGTLYTAAIPVAGTTIVRAAAFFAGLQPSASVTNSYIDLDEVLQQDDNSGPDTWAADYAMDPVVVNDPVYGAEIRDDLQSIPTISIVMDTDDLFGADNGIYTHPNRRGDEWERPASCELIRSDGIEDFGVNCGVRIQGDTSRLLNKKKSLRMDFQAIYGPSELDYPFFAGSPVDKFKKIRLRAGHQESWSAAMHGATYIRDQWARDTQLAMGQVSSHGNFVHVYLNGLYWGIYNAVERPDEDFTSNHLGGDPDDWDVIKHGPEIVAGDDIAWKAAHDLAQAGLESPAQYDAIRQMVNVPNLIDYILTNLYAGTTDWDANNYYVARQRLAGEGFHFFAWDTETCMKSIRDNRVTMANTGKPTGLYAALRANAEFRVLFGDHAHRHLFNGGALTAGKAWERFSARADEIYGAVVAESARWGDTVTSSPLGREDWLTEVERLRLHYFPQRGDAFVKMLQAVQLYPMVAAPVFGQHGGLFAAGFALSMTAPAGTIYYTLDGSDPRLAGGAVAPAAVAYAAPVALSQSATVKARAKVGADWSALTEASFVSDSGLRISELMYHPADPPPGIPAPDDDFEFVELVNVGASPASLAGVGFAEGIGFTFASGSLAPGAHVLVVSDPVAFESRYGTGLPIGGTFTGSLRNSGERLRLLDGDGGALHDFEFEDYWYPSTDGGGHSLVIRDPAGDISNWAKAEGWRASASVGGSPGAAELPVCNDLADNDGDGLTDLVDPGCADAASPAEDPQCNDSRDNDHDGVADVSDADCSAPSDDDETMKLVDSFVCYQATASDDDPTIADLTVSDDVSGSRTTRVGRPRGICLPASVAGAPVDDAATSLQIYGARDESGIDTPIEAGLLYTALGPISLDRGASDQLLIPSAMDPGAPVAAPNDAGHRLDRYKCYKASAAKGAPKYLPREVKISASDAFGQGLYDIRRPTRLCLPAGIDGGVVKEPRGGFLCYSIKLSRGQAPHTRRVGLFTADELASFQQDTRRVSEFCSPLR